MAVKMCRYTGSERPDTDRSRERENSNSSACRRDRARKDQNRERKDVSCSEYYKTQHIHPCITLDETEVLIHLFFSLREILNLAPSGLLSLFPTSSSPPPLFTPFQRSFLHRIVALPRSLVLHSSGLRLEAAVMQRRREAALRRSARMVYSGWGAQRPWVTAPHSQLLKRSMSNRHSPGSCVHRAAG